MAIAQNVTHKLADGSRQLWRRRHMEGRREQCQDTCESSIQRICPARPTAAAAHDRHLHSRTKHPSAWRRLSDTGRRRSVTDQLVNGRRGISRRPLNAGVEAITVIVAASRWLAPDTPYSSISRRTPHFTYLPLSPINWQRTALCDQKRPGLKDSG